MLAAELHNHIFERRVRHTTEITKADRLDSSVERLGPYGRLDERLELVGSKKTQVWNVVLVPNLEDVGMKLKIRRNCGRGFFFIVVVDELIIRQIVDKSQHSADGSWVVVIAQVDLLVLCNLGLAVNAPPAGTQIWENEQ